MSTELDTGHRLQEIEAEINSGSSDQAHKLLEPLILQENPMAYFLSSSFSRAGESIEAFDKRHLLELTKSADLGYPPAIYKLGAYYDMGDFVPVDKRKASLMFLHAAKLGHAHCAYLHAVELLFGLGTFPKNEKEAAPYLEQAAVGNHKFALELLAQFHAKGESGFPKDDRLSKKYSARAEAAPEFWELENI